METDGTMKTEKKTYNTPEIIDHGDLIELTQGSGNHGGWDADHIWQSGPYYSPPRDGLEP